MIEIINFHPFLAIALVIPLLTRKKELQYSIPISILALYYIATVGLDVAQLGYFASVLLATFISKRMNLLTAYLISMCGYHILANLSHGSPFTIAALEFDVSTFTATAFYLIIFKIIHNLVSELNKINEEFKDLV